MHATYAYKVEIRKSVHDETPELEFYFTLMPRRLHIIYVLSKEAQYKQGYNCEFIDYLIDKLSEPNNWFKPGEFKDFHSQLNFNIGTARGSIIRTKCWGV